MGTIMKRLLLTLATLFAAGQMYSANAGVSVTVGQPGFYGQIDIGDFAPNPRCFTRNRSLSSRCLFTSVQPLSTCMCRQGIQRTGPGIATDTRHADVLCISCRTPGTGMNMHLATGSIASMTGVITTMTIGMTIKSQVREKVMAKGMININRMLD